MSALDRLAQALADRYRIERELGAGGMATVYLAYDLKHDRQVAIKVLRPELAAVIGAQRFLAEIKTTAHLQHPHILSLFDSGEADGTVFYVMPFVEGESLRDRLTREKQLPVDAALRIAAEVADALEYAHRQGVVHRDIKPENILLHGGHALVADFGIALAAAKTGGTRMTETGMSLGTPQYMSPEQAMGEREITPRSDVYALGCVTYEMLTGEAPFTGPTAQAIVAKVLTAEPLPISAQRKTVPEHVEAAVLTALQKLPADRFASAGDFAQGLQGTGAAVPGRITRAASRKTGTRGPATLGLAAVSLVLLGVTVWALLRHPGSTGPRVYDAALPENGMMTFAATTATTAYGTPIRNISVSPAGDFAVYAAQSGDSSALWYRSLVDGTARLIDGTRGATAPRVSPDRVRAAYLVGGQVMLIPVAGGEPRRLLDGHSVVALNWLSSSSLVVMDEDGNRTTWIDPEAGVQKTERGYRCYFASWVSEEKSFLCSVNSGVSIYDPATTQARRLREARSDGSPGLPVTGSAFRIVDRRYLVYISTDGDLRAAPYNPKDQLVGRPVTLVTGVRREGAGDAQFDVAWNGTLVYAPGGDALLGHLVRLKPGSPPTPLPVDSGAFLRFDLSRDGRWLAAVVQASEGQELRVYDLRNGQWLTWIRAELVRHVLWAPAGDRLVAAVRDSTRWSVLSGLPASGGRPDTVLTYVNGHSTPDPVDIPGDGSALVEDLSSFTLMRVDPRGRATRLDTLLTGVLFESVSPDGRHLLYESSDERRVLVTSYPTPGRSWQVASDGVEPLWLSPSEVLFRSGASWFATRLNPATGEPAGAPVFWGRDPRFSDTPGWSNRPSHDGGIIYVQGPAQTASSYLRVIPNWVAQMERAVDRANR